MHELSLAEGIERIIIDSAQRENFQQVKSARLLVGELSGVEINALQFALKTISAREGLLHNCTWQFETESGSAWCMHCAQSVAHSTRGKSCPICGGYQLHPNGGLDFRLIDLIVE